LKLLQGLPEEDLRDLFRRLRKSQTMPANRGTIERDLAQFKWHRGSDAALTFCRAFGLPDVFAGTREVKRGDYFEVPSLLELPPLKAYQRGLLKAMQDKLAAGGRLMASSFTGTGKTRIAMEYLCGELAAAEDSQTVLWIAQKQELLDQACDAVAEIWPWVGRACGDLLQVFRYYQGHRPDRSTLSTGPNLVIATASQVQCRLSGEGDCFLTDVLHRTRLLVIDEAHHSLARGHQEIVEATCKARIGQPLSILGLTATPGRSNIQDARESRRLAKMFDGRMVFPKTPDDADSPLEWFQREGYLSTLQNRKIPVVSQVNQTWAKRGRVPLDTQGEERDYPEEFLKVIGTDSQRNRQILKELVDLHRQGKHALVFCVNIAQTRMLGSALTLHDVPCGIVHHKIDRRDRRAVINKFRQQEIRILLNVEVLTTGFDAPKVDTIVMCRPTLSRILYEQMIGRGLRGPEMGGTSQCEILDFTDNFRAYQLPQAWEAFWSEWQLDSPLSVQEESGWDIEQVAPIDE